MKILGERISSLRKQRGLSQAQLADKLKLSQSALGMYETGKKEPNLNTLSVLADFFNVSIDYLVGREKKSESSNIISLAEEPILEYGGAKSTEDDLYIIKELIARHNRKKNN